MTKVEALRDYKEYCKKGYKPHSSFYGVDGDKAYYQKEYACYSTITYNDQARFDSFWVFHNKLVEKDLPNLKEYINFILNSELFGDAFLTKNYENGMKFGFKVNVNQPFSYINSALMYLRWPFECHSVSYHSYKKFSWGYFIKLGFSPLESLRLSRDFMYEDGAIKNNTYNDNHLPFRKNTSLISYKKESFKNVFNKRTFIQLGENQGVSSSWYQKTGYTNLVNFKCETAFIESCKKILKKEIN